MVSPVGAGLNDSGPVGRRTVRRAVGLAVTGSVMLTAGLAAWLLVAVGGLVPQGATGVIRVAGLVLVAAGVLCGLAMIVTIVAGDRAARHADVPSAAGPPGDDAGPAARPAAASAQTATPVQAAASPSPSPAAAPAAPAPAASAASEPLPERVPRAGRLDAGPAQPWPLPPRPGRRARPAPEWAPEPGADLAAEPAPTWAPEPGVEQAPEPAAGWASEPAAGWASEPAAGWAPEPAAETRPARKPNVGWNPDSAEDWLRVLRGLRGSVQSPADRHASHED